MKPGNGRRAKAPCGHPGELIIGNNFVRCLQGCVDDSVAPKDNSPAVGKCPKCGSSDIRNFSAMPFTSMNKACSPCGAVWCDYEDDSDG